MVPLGKILGLNLILRDRRSLRFPEVFFVKTRLDDVHSYRI